MTDKNTIATLKAIASETCFKSTDHAIESNEQSTTNGSSKRSFSNDTSDQSTETIL